MSTIEPPSGHKIRAQQEEFNRIANSTLASIQESTEWHNLTPEERHDLTTGTLDDGVDIGVAPFNDQVAEDIEQTLDRHSEASPHTSNPSS